MAMGWIVDPNPSSASAWLYPRERLRVVMGNRHRGLGERVQKREGDRRRKKNSERDIDRERDRSKDR